MTYAMRRSPPGSSPGTADESGGVDWPQSYRVLRAYTRCIDGGEQADRERVEHLLDKTEDFPRICREKLAETPSPVHNHARRRDRKSPAEPPFNGAFTRCGG